MIVKAFWAKPGSGLPVLPSPVQKLSQSQVGTLGAAGVLSQRPTSHGLLDRLTLHVWLVFLPHHRRTIDNNEVAHIQSKTRGIAVLVVSSYFMDVNSHYNVVDGLWCRGCGFNEDVVKEGV